VDDTIFYVAVFQAAKLAPTQSGQDDETESMYVVGLVYLAVIRNRIILEQRALLNAQLENNQLQQKNETIAAQTQYDVAVKQAEKDAETQRIAAENANAIALANANAKAETEKINADNAAYVTRTKAEAERDARLATAEAVKAELEAKASGLNDFVIQQEFIEKWDGKLIPSFGDSGIGFTNYTDIIQQYVFSTDDSLDAE